MKSAYLIVPDLHYAVSKEHRKNYLSEVMSIMTQILSVRQKYVDKGYSVKVIFLGDVIDGPITQAEDAMRCQNLFRYYCAIFDDAYCVMGNHEANNVASNPFWFLVSDLEDEALKHIGKALQPQGVESVLRLPSTVVDGEVTFYFNHFGLNPKVPSKAGVAVGLFHQNVGSNDICKMWGTFTDVEEASFMQAYNLSFFGHMHLATGKFYLNDAHTCVGEWLGTCVGTNVVEVETLPRECKIPAVLIEGGKFISVEDNIVLRSDPSNAIDYERLAVTRSTSAMIKEVKDIAVQSSRADTLYQSVREAADNLQLGVLVDLLAQSEEFVKLEYKRGLSQVIVEGDVGSGV